MKIEDIDVNETIEKAKASIKNDKNISPTTKIIFALLITLVTILINRLNLNSSNSSKPPSSDENKEKKNRGKSNKPRGGQKGHKGVTLEPVSNPDEIKTLAIDKRKLPRNKECKPNGYIARQVVNIKISRIIIEYRAEVFIDNEGKQYVAPFPQGITRPIQYGASVKAEATYLSTYQLIPYERIQEQFRNEYKVPISTGSIYNFNAEASTLLSDLGFTKVVKQALAKSDLAHADETGINLDGKKIWLHNLSNDNWTWLEPHTKRGTKAMDDIGIIPTFSGILCHDHWKPYYTYPCSHSLCNAHHLRELIRAFEQDGQVWAEKMRILLLEIKKEVDASKKNALSKKKVKQRQKEYRAILSSGDLECPSPKPEPTKKGRTKRTKARNLLERLRDYEDDILRFMVDPLVPFTNNQGERDLRMTKVQQKISGCFRSMAGAINFCKVRSYLSTCKKNNVSATEGLTLLFKGKMPDFIQAKLDAS